MKCKLLSVEIEYDGELDNVEIVTKYGKILEQEDFICEYFKESYEVLGIKV